MTNKPHSIIENVSLANYTSFKVGGFCRYYCIASENNIKEAVVFAKENNLPIKILGAGFNTLVKDELKDSLVLHFKSDILGISFKEGQLSALAQTPLPILVNFAAKNSILGYEFLAGIPGSVGGAITMNAGVLNPEQKEISSLFKSAVIFEMDTLQIKECNFDYMEFAYRNSILQRENNILLSAKFKAENFGDSKKIELEIENIKAIRKSRQPDNPKNAGSIFKSVNGVSAGYYIEKCGLKGRRIGNASISCKHANWIVNESNAKAKDILDLMELAEELVLKNFGIKLEREIRLID